MNKPELFQTKDGSHTLYSSQYNQHYHNPNGAIKESLYIFFQKNGLQTALENNESISVLEVGFGTGLNLMLLADMHESIKSHSMVSFYSIEAQLIDPEIASRLNYATYLKKHDLITRLPDFFKATNGNNTFRVTDHITFHLFNGLFEDFQEESLRADYILHDPFSPGVNPELWTKETFLKLKDHASSNAILSTYSSASKARQAMSEAGWDPRRIPGVLGKREMTVAVRKS